MEGDEVRSPLFPIFYYLFDAEILASTRSPIITQLVGLSFDGKLCV